MGSFEQIKAELKNLPLILAKLIGGLAAVIGFASAAIRMRTHGWSFNDIQISLLSGIIGVIVFALSARLLTKGSSDQPKGATMPMNALSWGVFLILAIIFLAAVYIITT